MERYLPHLPLPLARLWITLCGVLLSFTALAQRPFVTTWKTDNPGESITIPVNPDVSGYNYTVDWGDGTPSTNHTNEDAIHTYADARTYTVTISGSFPAIRLGEFGNEVSDKLVSIEQWGDIAWSSMEGAFSGARYMVLNATDVPNLSGVSSLARMFDGAELVNGNLNSWVVSSITDMSGMFNGAESFNGNITNWDVSSVTDMSWMFWGASVFNQDIGGWNVGNVEDMSFMFYQAPVFNQDLSSWNVSRVTTMNSMFFIAMAFDQSLGSWDISSVTDMDDMLLSTGLSSANYSATLIGWAALPTVPSNITLDATGLEYCAGTAAEMARQELEMKGWHIIGDNPATDCGGGGTDGGAFITTWQTTAADESITIRINPSVTGYSYTVDWGDGNTSTGQTGNATHAYATAGTYEVSISGDFPALYEAGQQLIFVEQWGDMIWQSMERAFMEAANLVIRAGDTPDLTHVTSMERAFEGTTYFSSDLSNWDVSSVENMSLMFFRATTFNGDLSGWDVSSVKNMANMFEDATSFNGDLNDWDVSSVENMHGMFMRATAFNGDISAWAPSRVTNMANMFEDATSFTGNLNGWDVSSVENMQGMFMRATAFNSDLSGWVPSRVTNMANMFEGAESFAGNLSGWDVSSVENMQGMFMGAATFNSDLSGWVTSRVTNMIAMFEHAASFNQDLGGWDVSSVENMTNMLNHSGLSPAHYDATLIGWATQAVQSDVILGAQGLAFCASADARQQLIDDHQWSIDDAGEATDCGGGGIGPADPSNFITVWKTDNEGTSRNDRITIPATGEFTYIWVDVSDASSTGSGSGSDETTITFPQAGTYEVRIAPTGGTPFHEIKFFQFSGSDKNKLLEVKNWGDIHWTRFQFNDCANLKITATDLPDLSNVTDLSFAFSHSGIDAVPNINDWDVSNVTNMGNLFESVNDFNQPLDKWDVSNVTEMGFMFDSALTFNQALDMWDVSKVVNISYMFRDAFSFNQPLGDWNLESIEGAVGFLVRTSVSCENYSQTLYGWATNPNTKSDITFGAYNVTYSPDVVPYRDYLIDTLDWNFQSGDVPSTCPFTVPDPPVTPDENNILYVDINVDTDAPGYDGSGDSWENAIPELADALRWAREQHDGGDPDWNETDPLRIFVAKGTYKPLYNAADEYYTTDGGRDNSFVLVPDVQLYGGFDPSAGIEALDDARILPDINNLAQGSILSGDFNGNDHTDNFDNHTENAYHVTIVAGEVGSARIDGFTITGGNANTSGGVTVFGRGIRKEYGGGTVVITSSPQLTHMAWSTNFGLGGGGLFNSVNYLTEESSPKLTQVSFFGNSAPFGGGGIWNYNSYIEITGAVFADNGAGHETDGTSSGPGGAIYSTRNNNEKSLALTNATFYGNRIIGVFFPSWDGAAIHVDGSTATLTNVIAWGNEVEGDATATSASVSVSDGEATVANSLMANLGGSGNWNSTVIMDGGGNIDADPLFVSTTPGEAGYLQLSACSPAISVGDNQGYTNAGGDLANDLDLAGHQRVYNLVGGGVIDMGAYEYQGERVFVQSLTIPDAVSVAYGTALEDVEGLPTSVTSTLSDDREVSIPLDGNLANWTLVSPAGGTFEGDLAGTYVFSVPLLIPETECYLNTENLAAEVTVIVTKGTPVLAASWNGTSIDATEGLSLTYGDSGELVITTTDPDGELTYGFGNDDLPVLDMADMATVAARQVGTATLTIEQEESENFDATAVEIVVTVTPKAITIVPTAGQGKVYGAVEPATYGYELTEGDALGFDDELTEIVSAASREAGVDVGHYDIELAFAGELANNYAVTFEMDNNAFTITPLPITVTAEDKSKVFGSDDPSLTYTFTPNLIGDDAFAGGLARDEGNDVGSYAITQGDLALDDNYILAFEPGTLTITPAAYAGVEFNNGSFVYDGTEHVLELTGELPEGAAVTYEIDGEPGNGATAAGAYEITALIDGGNNYEDLELTAALTITPLEITVTAADKTKVFGSDDPALTYTFAPELIGDDVFTGELDREVGENTGTYAITRGDLALDDNYEISFVEGMLTITSAAYEGVELNDLTVTYDGIEHVLELTGELPEGVSVTYEINGEPGNSAADAGTYEVTANIDGGDNYDDIMLTATLTIEKATITGLRFEDKEYIYQGTAWEILINGDLPAGADVTYADNQQVDVGEYEATAIVSGDNYNTLELHAKFTILPLQLTVTADHKQKVYGGGDPALTYTAVPALVGPDSFTGGLVREDGEAVGEYTIMQGDLSAGDNYEITFEAGILTIVSAGYQDVVFNNASFVYDGKVKSVEIDGELPEGATVRYTIDGDGGNGATDAGTYEVTAVVDGGDNYGDLELTATLEIIPAERTLDFPVLPERTYGDDDFDAGAAASSGEDITYTSSNAAVAEVTDGGLIRIVGAGEATIMATVPENSNYSSRPNASRPLTVHKAAQTITFNAPAEVNRDAGSIELDVSASSGMPVSLTLDDEQVATLEGTTLNIHRLGMATIIATQAGDDNYEAAEPVMVTVRVVDPQAELPVRVHKVISPNGDGINEFLMIEGVRDYPENRMTIVNRNGTIVWEGEGYDNANMVFRGTFTGGHNAPAGTYFYILEVRVDGGWKHEKGWFVLRY